MIALINADFLTSSPLSLYDEKLNSKVAGSIQIVCRIFLHCVEGIRYYSKIISTIPTTFLTATISISAFSAILG